MKGSFEADGNVIHEVRADGTRKPVLMGFPTCDANAIAAILTAWLHADEKTQARLMENVPEMEPTE